jgi:hypothetical protein
MPKRSPPRIEWQTRLCLLVEFMKTSRREPVHSSPNKTLQRSWTHKLLGCRRASAVRDAPPRAGMLRCRRAAAELCS